MGTVHLLVIAIVFGGVTAAAVAVYRTSRKSDGKPGGDARSAAAGAADGARPRAADGPGTQPPNGSRAQPPDGPSTQATDGSRTQTPDGQRTPAMDDPSPQTADGSRPKATAQPLPRANTRVEPAPSPGADRSDLEFTLDTPDKLQTQKPISGPGRKVEADRKSLTPPETLAKLFELALGRARPASTVTTGHDDVSAAVATILEDIASQDRYVPRRPDMLPKILSASNDESFSRRELAALIARDPSLVGNLLKIANSSYYRVTPEPVESVERAVVLLGTNGIRSLVTASVMQPIFRIGGADFPRFPEIAWEHTFRSASATVPYNFLAEESDPFAAELLSLVMGLSEIVIFRVTLDQYAKYPRLRPDGGVVAALLDKHSAAVARGIGASWELSEPTLAGLDGQSTTTTSYPTALGRSLYFGRVVGALAVLRIKHVIDDEIGKASIPKTAIPEAQLERMWTRLTVG